MVGIRNRMHAASKNGTQAVRRAQARSQLVPLAGPVSGPEVGGVLEAEPEESLQDAGGIPAGIPVSAEGSDTGGLKVEAENAKSNKKAVVSLPRVTSKMVADGSMEEDGRGRLGEKTAGPVAVEESRKKEEVVGEQLASLATKGEFERRREAGPAAVEGGVAGAPANSVAKGVSQPEKNSKMAAGAAAGGGTGSDAGSGRRPASGRQVDAILEGAGSRVEPREPEEGVRTAAILEEAEGVSMESVGGSGAVTSSGVMAAAHRQSRRGKTGLEQRSDSAEVSQPSTKGVGGGKVPKGGHGGPGNVLGDKGHNKKGGKGSSKGKKAGGRKEELMEGEMGSGMSGEEDLLDGSIPGAQNPNWGECEQGPTPEGCPAMAFIKRQEGEGSQGCEPEVGEGGPQGQDGRQQEGAPGTGQVSAGSGSSQEGELLMEGVEVASGAEGGGIEEAPEAQGPKANEALAQPGNMGANGSVCGGEGEAQDETRSPPRAVLPPSQEEELMGALRGGRSFANVAGTSAPLGHIYAKYGAAGFQGQPGGQSTGSGSGWSRGAGGPERPRRNVVQLRYLGSGPCPSRGVVVDMVLDLGIRVAELFAVIHPHSSNEFDVSFMTPVIMEGFLTRQELVKGTDRWRDFRVVALSRQEEIKNVTILVRNESLPPQDIVTWLGRFGLLQSPLVKCLDQKGIWTGAWQVRVKLTRSGNTVRHIPASTFIGRDRILAFYPGQPRLCFKCGSPTHFSADCTTPRCVRCGGLGHSAERCALIRCNLCGEMGHPFSRCPRAFRGFSSGGAERPSAGAGTSGAENTAGGGVGGPGPAAEEVVKKKDKTNQQLRRQERRRMERESAREEEGQVVVEKEGGASGTKGGKGKGEGKGGRDGGGGPSREGDGPGEKGGGAPVVEVAPSGQEATGARISQGEAPGTSGTGRVLPSQKRARSEDEADALDSSSEEEGEDGVGELEELPWEIVRGRWKKRGARGRVPPVVGGRGSRARYRTPVSDRYDFLSSSDEEGMDEVD